MRQSRTHFAAAVTALVPLGLVALRAGAEGTA